MATEGVSKNDDKIIKDYIEKYEKIIKANLKVITEEYFVDGRLNVKALYKKMRDEQEKKELLSPFFSAIKDYYNDINDLYKYESHNPELVKKAQEDIEKRAVSYASPARAVVEKYSARINSDNLSQTPIPPQTPILTVEAPQLTNVEKATLKQKQDEKTAAKLKGEKKYGPEAALGAIPEAGDIAKGMLDAPQIGNKSGEQLLGEMIAWILMMLAALFAEGANKIRREQAIHDFKNMAPQLKAMAKLVDKKRALDDEIKKLEKKYETALPTPNEAAKLKEMKEKSQLMQYGLDAYQRHIQDIANTKLASNDKMEQKAGEPQLDLALGEHKKDIDEFVDKTKKEFKAENSKQTFTPGRDRSTDRNLGVLNTPQVSISEIKAKLVKLEETKHLSECGIKNFQEVPSNKGLPACLKIDMYCTADKSEQGKTAPVKVEQKLGTDGVTYTIPNELNSQEKTQIIDNSVRFAVETAKPGTVFNIPNADDGTKIAVQEALDKHLAAKFGNSYKKGENKVPDKPKNKNEP